MSLTNSSSDFRAYLARNKSTLEAIMNHLCAEGRWMQTRRFVPTPAWEHALTEPDCPNHLLLVARDGEQLIGWCRAFPTGAQGEAEIGIGLLPPYRDHGLGTDMLKHTLDWAKERSLVRLILTTRDDNRRAIHTFGKCGFAPTGRSEGRWIEMARTIEHRTRRPGRE